MADVILLSSKTWPHCRTAKEYLSKKGIDYIEKDVNKDPSAQQEMMRRKIRGVPAFIIDDEAVVGLNIPKIEKLLSNTTLTCPSCSVKMRVPKNKGNILITCPKCKEKFKATT